MQCDDVEVAVAVEDRSVEPDGHCSNHSVHLGANGDASPPQLPVDRCRGEKVSPGFQSFEVLSFQDSLSSADSPGVGASHDFEHDRIDNRHFVLLNRIEQCERDIGIGTAQVLDPRG